MNMPEYKGPQYSYRAEVLNVVDGDTIDVLLDLGCNIHVVKRLRLLGVDTFEMRGEEREKGKLAKQFTENMVFVSRKNVTVQTEMDADGKYGRMLAWVWVDSVNGPICLNEELIEKGHGVEYNM